jgi:hypothetical protein
VRITEPVQVSVLNAGSGLQQVTGSVRISEPITGSVGLTAPITGSVGLSAPITGSVGITHPLRVKIIDTDGENTAIVSADGRLQVSTPPPAAPTGTTPVKRTAVGGVTANQTFEDIYTIPNGSTLTVQRLLGGGENSVAGGRVELIYRTTGSADELLAIGYIAGGNFQFDFNDKFVGNGERIMILRRVNQGGSSMHMFARWSGYLE